MLPNSINVIMYRSGNMAKGKYMNSSVGLHKRVSPLKMGTKFKLDTMKKQALEGCTAKMFGYKAANPDLDVLMAYTPGSSGSQQLAFINSALWY